MSLPSVGMKSTEWLGSPDAAELCGVTQRTLYRLVDQGRVPAYAIGRVLRFKRSDLEAFLDGAVVVPGSLAHLYPKAKP